MRYISTRGDAPVLGFEDVTLTGLASDGGLYVPEHIPTVTPDRMVAWAALPYDELAVQVMLPFVGDDLSEIELRALAKHAYQPFRHPATAPLVQVGEHRWILELFHGPTLAFKDFALQLLGRLLDHFLQKRGEHITIVGATSGDTGSAAIAGCRGRDNMDIFIFHPNGRVSDVQRRQMTTVDDANVHNLALTGTFDDCQDTVKALFSDAEFRSTHKLAAVNSINWARILAQVVYYFHAALALGAPAREVDVAVPTGNFGDIFAGYIAQRMGLPIRRLIIATNANDILDRCVRTGTYGMEGVMPTLSPSMDIQISSNFERLLFDLYGRDSAAIQTLMSQLKQQQSFTLDTAVHTRLQRFFASGCVDDEATLAAIARLQTETSYIADPHTAVGLAAAEACGGVQDGVPLIVLATAHPAKFPDAVEQACGITPPLPHHVQPIMAMEERFDVIPAGDLAQIKAYIETQKGKGGA